MSLWARTVLLLSIALVLGGCTDRDETEARLVIDHVDAIDPYGDVADRRKRVAQLQKLGVETPAVRKVRDACVHAHETLLEAEDLQKRAQKELDAAEAGKAAGKPVSEKAAKIGQTISRSNDALMKASELLPDCQHQVARLASRYEIHR